jgi:hypothetical protein
VDAAPQTVPYRRIGTILVERQLITAGQLARALEEQGATGRPLGEICVERFGLDRLSLADALAEQWEEMQRVERPSDESAGSPPAAGAEADGHASPDSPGEDELRTLLEEAQAARLELEMRTDELGRRLAALETLVVGVSDALTELRSGSDGQQAPASGSDRARRSPRARATSRRAAAS